MSEIHIGRRARRKDGLTHQQLSVKRALLLIAEGISQLPEGEYRTQAAVALRWLNQQGEKHQRLAHEDLIVRGLDS